ncbi:MAG: hypothetical protein QOE92_930, partial [Chloroflexota bacterium]|nr:hypothetical protein [Chloroflexota bacterium]
MPTTSAAVASTGTSPHLPGPLFVRLLPEGVCAAVAVSPGSGRVVVGRYRGCLVEAMVEEERRLGGPDRQL